MNETSVKFLRSLLFVAIYISMTLSVANVSESIIIDFISHKFIINQSNAVWIMLFGTVLAFLIAFIGTFIVFTVPQYLHGTLTGILYAKYGPRGLFFAIAAIPMAALLAWYCYDYLTPSDFGRGTSFRTGWVPYKHGITLERYFKTLLIQIPISVFSLVRLWSEKKDKLGFSKYLPFVLLAVAVVGGALLGLYRGGIQLRFLK
jgi:hypothetical protein